MRKRLGLDMMVECMEGVMEGGMITERGKGLMRWLDGGRKDSWGNV